MGRGDWDLFFFYNEVPQTTIFSYHQFPLWNPYYRGGTTLIGHPEVSHSPLSFIFNSLFGVVSGLRASVIFYLFLGLLGMYFLSRHLGIRGFSSLLPGIIFMMSGPFVLHISEGHLSWIPMAYLPLVFLFYLKGLERLKFIFVCAILLSLMFYSGAIYIGPFTGLFLLLFAIFTSIQKKQANPIVSFMILSVLFILFSGPKLFPTLEFMFQYPRPTIAEGVVSAKYLFDIFLSTEQSLSRIVPPYPATGWWECGTYIGFLPACLFLLSFCLIKREWPLLLTGIVFFLIGLGNNMPYSLWSIIHRLPVFNNMRVSPRALICFIFPFSILTGLYLNRFERNGSNARTLRDAVVLIVFCIITIDLIKVHGPIFFQQYVPFKFVNTRFQKDNKFQQIYMPDTARFRYGGYSAMYPQLLSNKGVINGYEPFPIPSNAIPAGGPKYQGEVFLKDGHGDSFLSFWSPNKIVVNCKINSSDTLVINQNFDKNWKTDISSPVRPYHGLLSVAVRSADRRVTFYYLPSSFVLGLLALFVGILLFVFEAKILVWLRLRPNCAQGRKKGYEA